MQNFVLELGEFHNRGAINRCRLTEGLFMKLAESKQRPMYSVSTSESITVVSFEILYTLIPFKKLKNCLLLPFCKLVKTLSCDSAFAVSVILLVFSCYFIYLSICFEARSSPRLLFSASIVFCLRDVGMEPIALLSYQYNFCLQRSRF